jgi:hypothetical protein
MNADEPRPGLVRAAERSGTVAGFAKKTLFLTKEKKE